MQALRVVVIDDEPSTCAFLRAVFAAEGHQCQTFLRAEEAEQYLAANEADLAMVDVYLGPLNGIDLLQRLRKLRPKIYPVIMTANVSVETAARALSEGAVDYVCSDGRPASHKWRMCRTRRSWGAVRRCWRCTRPSGGWLRVMWAC